MTKARLLAEITSEELTEWIALWALRAEERERDEWQRRRR